MLYSKEKCVGEKKRPHFSLWFGNFFEPYYSDRALVASGMNEIAEMGFNSVILDSKLWEDFTAFFETGGESDYVAMQRFMIDCAEKRGLGINFLTLFYNGDNLYPHIRDSAPDIINPVIDRKGQPFRGYKHWDKEQTAKMIRHTAALYEKLAGSVAAKAVNEKGENKTPCYFYHSPAVMPSFDEDGVRVYFDWLVAKHKEIGNLNAVYETAYKSFSEIAMQDVWPVMTADDYKDKACPRMKMHRDNMLFRQDILDEFFKELTAGVRREIPDIYLYDCLSQWKYFLPDWVEISERGLDLWRLGKHLDCPSFYTLPADAYGEPNCYVVSLENAMLRSASKDKDIVSGLFLGRYLFGDIYSAVTPEEAIAASFAAGATDMFFYGYSGLDDGGNFGKWSADRKKSVKDALDWFADVREMAGRRISDKKAAILFPAASFAMDNRGLNDKDFRASRNDLLGYYQQLCDLGINADILDRSQVGGDILKGYSLIVLPSDPFYELLPDKSLETALRGHVENGGTVIGGASCGLLDIFDIKAAPHSEDSFVFEETVTEFSQVYLSFEGMENEAVYCSDGKTAIGVKSLGQGKIYAIGIDFGAAYCGRKHKPVPVAYGRQAHYPITVIGRTPLEKWTAELGLADSKNREIERVAFENGMVIINHTSYDYVVKMPFSASRCTGSFDGRLLHGHQALFLKK